jgi:hypothetical protein
MDLKELSKKPQLLEVVIDDEKIVEKYGDSLTFYIYDRQPLDLYGKLSKMTDSDFEHMNDVFQELILDKDGNKVMDNEHVLPIDVVMAAVTKVGERLGKL